MIVGTGVDIVEVERIKRVLGRWGDKFLGRVFTPGERDYCLRKRTASQHLASRFAAKESLTKALGCGMAQGIRWVDMEVVREQGERPTMVLHGKAREIAHRKGVKGIKLTLSHTNKLAMAMVVLED